MKNKVTLIMTLIMIILSIVPCLAQEGIKKVVTDDVRSAIKANSADVFALARDTVKFERMMVIANNMELSSKENEAFWQEYGRYQDRLDPLRDRAAKLIITYSQKFDTLSDEDAKAMLEELLSIQEDEVKVQREVLPKFEAILPMKKVARFYQLENKMNAEVRYQLSLEVPLLVATMDNELSTMEK